MTLNSGQENRSQSNKVHGDAAPGVSPPPEGEVPQVVLLRELLAEPKVAVSMTRLLQLVEMDRHLNSYSPLLSTILVPQFTFPLVACLPFPAKKKATQENSQLPGRSGSGTFDLAHSLGLLASQENGNFKLPMVKINIGVVGRYSDRYCGYLSRDALVHLASLYQPTRVTIVSDGRLGRGMVVETSLGRFRIFEHGNRTCVLFSSQERAERPDAADKVIDRGPWDRRAVVQRVAEGQYLGKSLYLASHETPAKTRYKWTLSGTTPTIKIAILDIIERVKYSVFLTQRLIREWEEVAQFSSTVLEVVSKIFLGITEPSRLVQLRDAFSTDLSRVAFEGITTLNDKVEKDILLLTSLVYRASVTPGNLVTLSKLDATFVHELSLRTFTALQCGHEKFRKAKVAREKLIDTSDKRFIDLFEGYKTRRNYTIVEEELRKLLHKTDNICLVLWQGTLAMIAYRNARKMLESSIESPMEWIQFILKQNSQLLLG